MRPPVELGFHRAPRCEPVVSLVRSRRAPPVPRIVLPKSCSCKCGPCPPPPSLVWVVCFLSFFFRAGERKWLRTGKPSPHGRHTFPALSQKVRERGRGARLAVLTSAFHGGPLLLLPPVSCPCVGETRRAWGTRNSFGASQGAPGQSLGLDTNAVWVDAGQMMWRQGLAGADPLSGYCAV